MQQETIQDKIQTVIKKISYFEAWEDRYRQIISMGRKLEPLKEEEKGEERLVKGCLSRVWLVPECKDQKIYFKADSDAAITKGIIALLVQVYSGESAETVLSTSPDFLEEIGISQHLSMNRRNGLANMCKMIQHYAELCAKGQL